MSHNDLQELPEWIFNACKSTIERLDLSFNPRLSKLPPAIGQLESLKSLHINGNGISRLPQQIAKLSKVEEFGLEWWPYVTFMFDGSVQLRKNDIVLRDDTIVTNRQILRQIFDCFRLVGQREKAIRFKEFYHCYRQTYSFDKNTSYENLFRILCLYGHAHLLD